MLYFNAHIHYAPTHTHARAHMQVRKLLAERNQLSKQLYTSKQENTKLEGKVQVYSMLVPSLHEVHVLEHNY